MKEPEFKVVQEFGDEGPHEFFVNGEKVGDTDHDQHGWQGMEDMCSMFENIAAQLGVEVIYEDVEH